MKAPGRRADEALASPIVIARLVSPPFGKGRREGIIRK
jgi:hypothetical protein